MSLYEALKNKDLDIRVTNDAKDRWLVWDETVGWWVVYQRRRYERVSRCLYSGTSPVEAVEMLIEE